MTPSRSTLTRNPDPRESPDGRVLEYNRAAGPRRPNHIDRTREALMRETGKDRDGGLGEREIESGGGVTCD